MLNKKLLLALVAMICVLFPVFPQTVNRLAILPFTGAVERTATGNNIASKLEADHTLGNAIEIVPRGPALNNYLALYNNLQSSDFFNKEKLPDLGQIAGANLILSGEFCMLGGDLKIILSYIVNLDSLQQISGDYRQYNTTNDIERFLPEIAEYLVGTYKNNHPGLPRLAIMPFSFSGDFGDLSNDAEVLAHILATEIINSGKYAVLPRNPSIDEKVNEELKLQRDDEFDENTKIAYGNAAGADYLLSVCVSSIGSKKSFIAQINNIKDGGKRISSGEINFEKVSDGFYLMAQLSEQLTGVQSKRSISQKSKGDLLFNKKHYEEAINAYNAAIKFAQNYTEAYYMRGRCLSLLNKGSDLESQIITLYSAINDFKYALDRDETNKEYKKQYNAAVNEKERLERKLAGKKDNDKFLEDLDNFFSKKRFFSLGGAVSATSEFPWAIDTLRGSIAPILTVSPFESIIVELGCDFDIMNNSDYYQAESLNIFSANSPYLHIGVLAGTKSFWYLGLGGSLLNYNSEEKNRKMEPLPDLLGKKFVMDAWTGFYFGERHNYFNLGYTFHFWTSSEFFMSHRIHLGYSYRF